LHGRFFDDHILPPPEWHIGKILSENFLRPGINLSPFLLAANRSALLEQTIKFGIAIVATIVARWRKIRGMKNLKQNIGIQDANPGKRVKMKIALFDVAVKCRSLVTTNIQLDANFLQLFFDGFGDPPAQIDVGGFEGQRKTR